MRQYLLGVLLVLGLTTMALAGDGQGMGKPPQGGPGGGKKEIPQEAITACSGKAEGDACQAGPGTGVCSYTPDKKYFACKPDHMPSGGPDSSFSSSSSVIK
ncbi:MAG: hypothetical protein V2A70_05740 [Candidatus Omnitrophota bacterium]